MRQHKPRANKKCQKKSQSTSVIITYFLIDKLLYNQSITAMKPLQFLNNYNKIGAKRIAGSCY